MFTKFSWIAALALAPWASALFLQLPVDWKSSSNVNVSWTHEPTDPPFTFQLVNTDEFHDTFGIANNVNPTLDFIAFQLGVVPQGQYTLRAINVTNAGQIYDETPSFTIQGPPPDSTTRSGTATTPTTTLPGTTNGSSTVTVPPASNTAATNTGSTGFGTTVSNTNSATQQTGTNTATGTSTSNTSVPSNFNGNGNGAAALPRLAPWAAIALGVVAGAAAAL